MSTAPTKYWLINAACAVVVLLLLGMHMAGIHLDDVMALIFGSNTEPLSWAQVNARGTSTFMTVSYILLLGTALFHGFYGLHTILTEFWPGPRASRVVLFGCWAAGIVLFLTGSIATVAFHFQAQVL